MPSPAPPGWLLAGDTTYQSLDIAWTQWAGPGHGASRGLTAEQFRDANVAQAKQLGLGLVFGLDYLDGGDGSSGIRGTSPEADWWQMSAAELMHVGTVLAAAPYSVAAVAAARGGTSCLGHDST